MSTSQPHAGPPHPQQQSAPPLAPPPVDPKVAAAEKAARAAASIGAQVILAFDGDGSLGARGGAGATVAENAMARDAFLTGLGLDPVAPSGPPPSPEQIKAKQADAEAKEKAAASGADVPLPKPTRVSSLAMGNAAAAAHK